MNDMELARQLMEAIRQTDEWEAIWQEYPGVVEAKGQLDRAMEQISAHVPHELVNELWEAFGCAGLGQRVRLRPVRLSAGLFCQQGGGRPSGVLAVHTVTHETSGDIEAHALQRRHPQAPLEWDLWAFSFPLCFPFNLPGLIGCYPKRTGEKSCAATDSGHEKKPADSGGYTLRNAGIRDIARLTPVFARDTAVFLCLFPLYFPFTDSKRS